MKVGFIKPTYPGEKRVALLPDDISLDFKNELIIEQDFGSNLSIDDSEYEKKGCIIDSRDSIFRNCDAIFCLKLIQPEDYDSLRDNQMIIGWTHPTGSGAKFYQDIAKKKNLIIVDLDNVFPSIYQGNKKVTIPFVKRNFIWKNSFNAGIASVQHALLSFGLYPNSNTKVAVLASGSVSQGAYNAISRYNVDIRMFYRKTMNEFYETINEYDVIINGIEVDNPNNHIITKEQLKLIKKGCLIIDSAADAGNAIEGTHYTSIADPIYEENNLYFYEVNNAPSLIYRKSSIDISEAFSKYIFQEDVVRFKNLIK